MIKKRSENGELMLEGMIIVLMTMFILFWLLAVGFLHYERYLVTVVTNDAAKKVAMTYSNPTADMVMGYIELDDLGERELYRDLNSETLDAVNTKRAGSYVDYMLRKFSTAKDIEVEMKFARDNASASRGHVELVVDCTFDTPFSGLLEAFGLKRLLQFESVAYAECQDLCAYVVDADFVADVTDFDEFKLIKIVNSTFKLVYKREYERK